MGLGFGLGGLRFVRGFGFWSRRRSGLRFAVGGFAVGLGLPWVGFAVGVGVVVVVVLVSAWWWSRGCGCGCGVAGGLRREK